MQSRSMRRCIGILAAATSAWSTGLVAQEHFPESTNISAAFLTKAGFAVELVAAEPDVVAPVAMAFDERGRLFVAERPDASPQVGRVRLLEDPQGTGSFNV